MGRQGEPKEDLMDKEIIDGIARQSSINNDDLLLLLQCSVRINSKRIDVLRNDESDRARRIILKTVNEACQTDLKWQEEGGYSQEIFSSEVKARIKSKAIDIRQKIRERTGKIKISVGSRA